ncbi:MAG: hypothetical protein NZ529_09705 [Cytophagaceae bacterium]|nr:hypothetical protein [Cytophagaceae bacterium]MDW8457061.1 hypothetical protein [Cytophagaceae bacterium]
MIKIKPLEPVHGICPECNCHHPEMQGIIFHGKHILADMLCTCCEKKYYHTIPVAHDALFPMAISQHGKKHSYHPQAEFWLAQPLIQSLKNSKLQTKAQITFEQIRHYKNIILLNCLDKCYGHILYKCFNAYRYLNLPDTGLVMLIPSFMRWIVPDGVAEVWHVHLPAEKLNHYILNLNTVIHQRLTLYQNVLLATSYIHPELEEKTLYPFLKTHPFDLKKFYETPFRITFFLRNDRFWLSNDIDYFLLLVCKKYKILHLLRPYFLFKQTRLVKKFARIIHKKNSAIELIATGVKNSFSLGPLIKDLRKQLGEDDPMHSWTSIYAQTHIVIGVHGSHMLVPTALSAAFIEIVPHYKLIHYTEDILFKNSSSRLTLFLGRILTQCTSAKILATHALHVLEHFKYIYENTNVNFSCPKTEVRANK